MFADSRAVEIRGSFCRALRSASLRCCSSEAIIRQLSQHQQRRIQGRFVGFGRTPPPAGCGGWKR